MAEKKRKAKGYPKTGRTEMVTTRVTPAEKRAIKSSRGFKYLQGRTPRKRRSKRLSRSKDPYYPVDESQEMATAKQWYNQPTSVVHKRHAGRCRHNLLQRLRTERRRALCLEALRAGMVPTEIAEATGVSFKSVTRWIKRLVADGLITVPKHHKRGFDGRPDQNSRDPKTGRYLPKGSVRSEQP